MKVYSFINKDFLSAYHWELNGSCPHKAYGPVQERDMRK